MKHLLLLTALLFTVKVNAQQSHGNDTANGGKIYQYVEQMPVAGYDYNVYLKNNLHYPDTAMKYKIEGRVVVKFLVNEDGSLTDFTVVRGVGGGCDEEALRVVKSFPSWKPGKQNGKPVRVYYTLPIVFKLAHQ